MRRQRRLDERLRQWKSDLAQIFRVRTQDHDLLRRQTGREHQPVEIVILDFADEDAPECLLEYRMQRIDLDLGIGNPGLHSQIVHPDRRRAFRCHAIRALVEDLQSHVFQHRQAIGESHRRAKMVELEAQRSGRRFERPIERHPQRLGLG